MLWQRQAVLPCGILIAEVSDLISLSSLRMPWITSSAPAPCWLLRSLQAAPASMGSAPPKKNKKKGGGGKKLQLLDLRVEDVLISASCPVQVCAGGRSCCCASVCLGLQVAHPGVGA